MQQKINFQEAMPTTVRKFFEFHDRQPGVYEAIKEKANRILTKTRRSVSFSMIYETARFEHFVSNDEDEVFKMNNNFRAGYLRMFLRDFPMYRGRIEMRSSVYDDYIKIEK